MKSLKWLYSDDQATQRQQSLPQIHCAHIWMHSLSSLNSSELKVIQSCSTLCDPMTKQSMEFSGQKTGVGSLSLLQGIVPTQGSNPGLPHCRQILYQLSHQGNPVEYYSAIKKNEILPFVTTWMDLEGIMLSYFTHMCNLKSKTNEQT